MPFVRLSPPLRILRKYMPLVKRLGMSKALLCTVKGDVLLGDIDSSGIVIKEVNFLNNMKLEPLDTVNGYIMLGICREGGDRLILQGNVPYVHVLVTSAKSTLYVCDRHSRQANTVWI